MAYGSALAQKNYEEFDLGVDATISMEGQEESHVAQLNIRSIVRSEPYSFRVVLKHPKNPLQPTAEESEKQRIFGAMRELFSHPEYKSFKGNVRVYDIDEKQVRRAEADQFLRSEYAVFSLVKGRKGSKETSAINVGNGWANLYFYAFQDGAEADGFFVRLFVQLSEDKLLDAFGGLHNIENELRKE